jgi:phenylacetate-coenzyme A ligase PaaK-like adenylate-forming protein
MSFDYIWKNLTDLARALPLARAGAEREGWPRERFVAFQHDRLARLVAHASTRSPFYRALYGGPIATHDVRLDALPTVTKTMMMDELDGFFPDRRLTRAALESHLAGLGSDDELFLGEYRVMASSGSSGRKGIYVYDRPAWRSFMAGAMRFTRIAGLRPRLPRPRICWVAAPDAKHMTRRGTASLSMGPFRSLSLSAAQPLAELSSALDRFQPDTLNGYPSALAMLATEQLEERLHIAPRIVATSSEVRTPEMTARIRAAWSVEPFDLLGLTETGITAYDCAAHQGMHVLEDRCIFEVVDEDGRPVADGSSGHKVLVTNLDNYAQPFIRFEVTDLVTLTDAPCECGRTTRRITALEGRSDDILELAAAGGGTVRVHPIHLRSPLAAMAEVAQYQIVEATDGLDVTIVVSAGAGDAARRVAATLGEKLTGQGVAPLPIRVRVVPQIAREQGAGKLKLIKSKPSASASPVAALRSTHCA